MHTLSVPYQELEVRHPDSGSRVLFLMAFLHLWVVDPSPGPVCFVSILGNWRLTCLVAPTNVHAPSKLGWMCFLRHVLLLLLALDRLHEADR